MAWPNAPANGQIFTRADGVQFQYRSASQSWLRLNAAASVLTQTQVATVGVSAVAIPSGAKKVRLRACGGGGAGGWCGGTNRGGGAAGGGSGFSGEALVDLTGVSSISANIGAGGVGGTGSAGNGGNTVITFTGIGTITFGGGTAGETSLSVVSNGTYLMKGAPGGSGSTTISGQILTGYSEASEGGSFNVGMAIIGRSGRGGNSQFGRGGRSRGSNNAAAPPDSYSGEAGQGYGSGGSGAVSSTSSAPAAGGNGANGYALFEWIF